MTPTILQNQESLKYNGGLMTASHPNGCQHFSMMWMFLLTETHGLHNNSLWSVASLEIGKHRPEALYNCFIFTFQSCDSIYEWKKKSKHFWTRKLNKSHQTFLSSKLTQIGHIFHKKWIRCRCLALRVCASFTSVVTQTLKYLK